MTLHEGVGRWQEHKTQQPDSCAACSSAFVAAGISGACTDKRTREQTCVGVWDVGRSQALAQRHPALLLMQSLQQQKQRTTPA